MKLAHLAFVGATVASAIPSIGNFQNFSSDVQQARVEADRIGKDMTELKLAQQEQEQKELIALERYQQGCLPVVDSSGANYVTLVLNMPVIDRASGHPLPVGSIVCDAHGNTGVIVDDDTDHTTPGVVQRMAFTGDRQAIDVALSQFSPAHYATPGN